MSGGTAQAPSPGEWFQSLAEPLELPAFQLAVLLVEDQSVAEDIVQEAFLRVWRSPRTPRDATGFRRWLYKTIVNLARDHHRRRMLSARLLFWLPSSNDPVEQVEQKIGRTALEQAIASLGWRERQALYLRFFDDAPFDDVAISLGMRETAARVLVHRALKKLRDRMSAQGFAPEGLAK
jgi:RNA polymerase sigma-70 factor (ECF subfamily)